MNEGDGKCATDSRFEMSNECQRERERWKINDHQEHIGEQDEREREEEEEGK